MAAAEDHRQPELASSPQGGIGQSRAADGSGEAVGGRNSAQVLSGGGGTGKTQLAAWYAHHALSEGVQLRYLGECNRCFGTYYRIC